MKGQWFGSYISSTGGRIIVNIDERELSYQGVAYLLPHDKAFPRTAAYFRTPDKKTDFQFRTEFIQSVDPTSGMLAPWDKVKSHYPQIPAFSKYADATGSWDSQSLSLYWLTDVGVTGNCVLPRSDAEKPSALVARESDWGAYKDFAASLEPRRNLFRGQKDRRRLRTSFHRTGRADLERFLREDVQVLRKHLSARTKHVFNLEMGDEFGAFLNLLQHHGYPTPLLDWTFSPYVAAFFAYRGISSEEAGKAPVKDKVRIHVFDQSQWRKDWNQVLLLICPDFHLSIGEFLAIDNERMVPQQAASTVTNIDDIESYIMSKESAAKKYLTAIDLPKRERKHVIRELSYMGITAGSLFPGLDGACEELREQNFEV